MNELPAGDADPASLLTGFALAGAATGDAMAGTADPYGIVALLAGESSIREVIAFPKTANAIDLMAGAPSSVDDAQLRELHLKIRS